MPPCAQARGSAFADWSGGKDGDRPRREFQRAEQAGQAAADDDRMLHAVGLGSLERRRLLRLSPEGREGQVQLFRLIMRSTARRALAAIAGSTKTSSCM